MRAPIVISVFVLLSAVVVWASWLESRPQAQPRLTVESRPQTLPGSQPAPVVRSVEPVRASPTPPGATSLALPDGTFVPLLNGVREAPAGGWWPADRPWSPIVSKERYADGAEWYVHADGCKSTTIMVWRSDLNREDPAVNLAIPVPALPVRPPQVR